MFLSITLSTVANFVASTVQTAIPKPGVPWDVPDIHNSIMTSSGISNSVIRNISYAPQIAIQSSEENISGPCGHMLPSAVARTKC